MPTPDEKQIRDLLATYENSLNTSDATLAASCYTRDGVFMPTTLPTASGSEMETAYARIFEAISLDIRFAIDEVVVASPSVAYALTTSSGTQTILEASTTAPESNREMFVFGRQDGDWKIARYMFNKAA
jgi:uncharacterized protein (TIGR02246 family)